MSYAVAIVVHPDYGDSLENLADRVHVWIAATPSNRARAEAYWRSHPKGSIERGITTFVVQPTETPEEMVERILGDVDLHHGEYSHVPPWDALEIYGASPTPAVREALAEYGIKDVHKLEGGWRCTRLLKGAV